MTKVLIIGGLGYWGTNLCRVFRKLVGKDNLLLADPKLSEWLKDKEKFASLGRDFLLTGMEYNRLMYEADAVVVATPPKSHFAIAKECLEAGKHVLVEKPLALSSMEAHTLLSIAHLKNVTLLSDDTWQYHDKAMATVRYLQQHPFDWGTVSLRWENPRKDVSDEGILWTAGPHPVSLALTALGGAVQVTMAKRLSDRSFIFTLSSHEHMANIELRWDVQRKRRSVEAVIANKQWWQRHAPTVRYLDDGTHGKPQREPLTCLAEMFLASCAGQFTASFPTSPAFDAQAVVVVRLLEQVQQLAAKQTV